MGAATSSARRPRRAHRSAETSLDLAHRFARLALASVLATCSVAAASIAIGDGDGDALGALSARLAGVVEDAVDHEVRLVRSAGSVETIERILGGELAMGLVFGTDAYHAYRGLAEFDVDEHPARALRALGYVVTVRSHLVTLEEAEIDTFGDLAGARLAVGEPGTGTAAASDRLLRQTGLSGRVTVVSVGANEAERLLRTGRIDAYHAMLADGDTARSERTGLRLVETGGPARIAGMFERFPTYREDVVVAWSHPADDAGVPSWSDVVLWVADDDLDEDAVYRMMVAVYGEAGPGHAPTWVAADGDGDGIRGVRLPLHRGAARFWTERGLEIPDDALPIEPR